MEKLGKQQKYVDFNCFNFTIFDEHVHHGNIDVIQGMQLIKSKTQLHTITDMSTYKDWVQGGDEVQCIIIDLPMYKGHQYFMIDVVVNDFGDRSNEIVLVHPVNFDNQALKDLIVEKIII